MSISIRLIVCFLIILLIAINGYTQTRFDSWTTEDGLPQNQINDIIQTSDGYLWLSTFNGLVRYDGVRFKAFNPGNTPGLNTNRLQKFFEDPAGDLWITTEHSGVIRYKNGAFKTYTTQDGLLDNKVVIRLYKQATISYLLFYSNNGAVKFINEQFIPCTLSEQGPYQGIGYQTSATAAWYVEQDGLHKVENGQEIAYLPITDIPSDFYFKLFEDSQGSLWMILTSELRRYKDGILTTYSSKDNPFLTAPFRLYEDRWGNLWCYTFGNGVALFKDGKFTIFTTADGLLHNNIWIVYQDRESNLWIGSSGGLNRLRDFTITAYSNTNGLINDNIYPIYQDSKGDLWIGSTTGLTKYTNGQFIQCDELTSKKEKQQKRYRSVKAILEDREGNFWFGFEAGFVKVRDGIVVTDLREAPLFDGAVMVIFQDRSGTIWFGTEKGLVKFKDEIFTAYTTEKGLAGNFVSAIYEDSQGTLWIGTQFGLSAMKGESFRNYGLKDGLSGYLVRAIYQDSDGVLWIGTYDGGLNRLKDGHITNYTTKVGLYDNGVSQILEDQNGNLWISCNLGIYRVKKRELNRLAAGEIRSITCVAYGKRDGMISAECNGGGQPAGIKARDGRLWFPTTKGIVVIDPARVPISQQPPQIMIEEIVVENETISSGNSVVIQPGKVNFEIHYTALSFIMSNQCRFKYKLAGLESDWIDAGTRRTAYYSHIPPGDYIFTIIGANRDGVWNLTGASIAVKVIPPYWRTWWFTTLIICVLVTSILFFFLWRFSKLKRERQAQETFSRQLIESQENERKRLAAELHDSLAQSLMLIKHRTIMAVRAINKNGNIEEHLNEISTTTDLAIDEVSELSYNLRPYQLDRLGLGQAIEVMLERVSGSSGILCSAKIDPIEGLFSQQQQINAYRIIQECVNNIVKHSGASRADIKIERNNSEIRITINDNGKGFNQDNLGKISSIRSGFGLNGIAERTRMIGGKHQIESKPGAGTKITIQLNLRNIRDGEASNHSNS